VGGDKRGSMEGIVKERERRRKREEGKEREKLRKGRHSRNLSLCSMHIMEAQSDKWGSCHDMPWHE